MKFCVIGLGRFGQQIAISLAEHGMEVLAIDRDESIVNSIKDKVTRAICLDVTDEESLRSVGVDSMDTAIVAMGENFEQSVLITALLKKQLVLPYVIARSTNAIHDEVLKLVGADQVVLPERYVGIRLANNLSLPFVDLVHISDAFSITQITVPESFVGKTIGELDLRKSKNVSCIAVKKGEELVLVGSEYVILDNDQLVMAGENKALAALAHV